MSVDLIKRKGNTVTFTWALLGLVLAFLLAFWLVPPYFEARAFNKFSKTKATYWDALWTELRVLPDK